MTKINKLILNGFKSFGEKTELKFGDNFNCILGPNGSGKSNIFDAICFVLGKGSAKGLRAEKSANLIYNGGKSRSPAKEGEVSIYFDNKDKTFPTDEEEVKITRIVKAKGNSVYKINDKVRTRDEILELLSIAKINPDGYNIVLQGDIVRFIGMSSNDKRLIIDDIAGISVYEEKKQKALNELNKVEEKLGEVEIVLNERKNYLDQLKDERKQALKFRELEGKIKTNKATILHREIEKNKKEKEEMESQIEKNKEKIAAINEEVEKLRLSVKEKKERIEKINEEIENRGEREQVMLHKEVENLRVSIATKESKIENSKKEIEKIEHRKKQLENNQKELEERIKQIKSEIEAYLKTRQDKENALNDVKQKIDGIKKKHNLDSISSHEEEIDRIEKEIEEKEKEIQVLREQQQELLREKDRSEIQISSIDEKIEKLNEIEKENKKELEILKNKREEFKKTTLELNKALQEDASCAAQLKNARQRSIEVQDKITEIKAKNASLNEKVQRDQAIQSVMENKNRLGTVYGPVYDLGNVKSKYSMALEVAAGARIKSIVVKDEETGANCIKYLKKNKLGIATFLPMNKIRTPERNKEVDKYLKSNGVLGKAVDLIEHDNKFKKIFEYVFGDTLVVEDIDVARRIGIGNVRMVTLTGDLVESSGAMHGGFRKKSQQFSFKEEELISELNKYEKELDDQNNIISMLESKRETLDDKITELRKLKADLEGDIIRMEKSLHIEPEELDLNNKMKEDLLERKKELDKKEMELNLNISAKTQELTKLKIKRQEIKQHISSLRDPAKLAELNTFEQQRDSIQETIGEIDNKVKGLELQLETVLEKEHENITKILRQNQKESDEFNKEIERIKKEIEREKNDLKKKEKEEKKFYEQFKTLFKERNQLSDKVQELEIKIVSNEEKSRNLEQKNNSIELIMTRINTELNVKEKEFEQYKDIPLSNKSDQALKTEITQFEKMVNDIGNVNLKAIELYDDLEKEYNKLIDKKKTLSEERNDVLLMMNEIETKKKDAFMETFNVINDYFKKMFTKLSRKGEAYLELENPDNPLDGGLNVKVKIGSKKFLDLRSLSGGEKTLTALAFIFAVQEYEPASFYVFDEVDAALDKRNAELLGKLIKEYAEKAQYVIVSHNDGVIMEADLLFGVSMREDGLSKVVNMKI